MKRVAKIFNFPRENRGLLITSAIRLVVQRYAAVVGRQRLFNQKTLGVGEVTVRHLIVHRLARFMVRQEQAQSSRNVPFHFTKATLIFERAGLELVIAVLTKTGVGCLLYQVGRQSVYPGQQQGEHFFTDDSRGNVARKTLVNRSCNNAYLTN